MKKLLALSLAILTIAICFASCDWFAEEPEHEHTWEYVQYETGHFKQYTCGCPSPDIMGEHVDNDGDYTCDECGYIKPSFDIEIEWQYSDTHHWWVPGGNDVTAIVYGYGEHVNADADLFCDVCGYDMSELPTPTNYFLRNHSGLEWMNEITADDIAEIKIISEAAGVAPGAIKNIDSSVDEAVIARLFEEYYWLDTWPISKEQGQVSGGSLVTVKFILNDGTVKEIYINNGNYLDTDGNYFELHDTPKFKYGESFTSYCEFITITGWDKCEAWCDTPIMVPYFVCYIPLEELKFNVFADNMGVGVSEYEYFIETDFGRLGFITNDVFFIVGSGGPYYQLVDRNLDELIAYYSLEHNYSVLIKAFWEKIPEADYVNVVKYYGEFDNGAIAAMMSCSEYDFTEAEWNEVIDGVAIHYSNGNRILVLYEGEFYNLTVAYENGYITKDDLITIRDLHNWTVEG